MEQTVVVVAAALLGLAVGSFLNVVIYRVPEGLSIVRPASACPHCHHPIRSRDNVPVLSYLLLRGHCRDCGAPIAGRYPLVEGLTAVLFAFLALRYGAQGFLLISLAAAGGLVALAAIDLERMILPKRIVYVTLIFVGGGELLDAVASGAWHRLGVAALCAVGWWLLFFIINLATPHALGFGDVRLAPLLGATLGWLGAWPTVIGFFVSNVIGLIVGLILMARGRAGRKSPVPYGTFLAAGTLLVLLAPSSLLGTPHLP